MFSIYDGREEFYQWDKDRKLIVEDKTIKEVHFCNKTDDCSLVCEVYEDGGQRLVNVPNILLTTDWRINVYGYTEDYTKHSACFKVNGRSKPADYVYTETEVLNYNSLLERVEALENNSGDSEALTAHINNKNNPHKITCKQIGAASKDDLIDPKTVIDCSELYYWEDSCEANSYNRIYWEKYLDGTFTCNLCSEIGFDVSISQEENIGEREYDEKPVAVIFEAEESTPSFDFFNIDYSYSIYFPYGDEYGLEYMTMEVYPVTEIGGPPGSYMICIYAPQETFDALRDAEVDSQVFFFDITITGTWR
jgi:hypothetical protein